eukprot:scaffold85036_cov49-Attheya_sp.AAC.1
MSLSCHCSEIAYYWMLASLWKQRYLFVMVRIEEQSLRCALFPELVMIQVGGMETNLAPSKMCGSTAEPYRRSLMGGTLPLTFCFCPLSFFLCHSTERIFMINMSFHVSSQAAGVTSLQSEGNNVTYCMLAAKHAKCSRGFAWKIIKEVEEVWGGGWPIIKEEEMSNWNRVKRCLMGDNKHLILCLRQQESLSRSLRDYQAWICA